MEGNGMRLNNLAARLIVNEWLVKTGRKPLPASLSYEEYATELRKAVASKQMQVAFASRADAIAYLQRVARRCVSSMMGTR